MKKTLFGLMFGAAIAATATPAVGQTRPGFEAGLEAF